MAYLGIDLGTSGLRALLTDDEGQPIGASEAGYPTANPHAGWSEQNPQDWIVALSDAVADLRARHPVFENVKGIAVSGQMHGAVFLDADDNVIRPCILWNDTRSHREAAQLDAIAGVRNLSGNIVFPGFTAPKHMWLRENEPENFGRVAKILLPAAYLNLFLTGDYVADLSDASGTSWLDIQDREWSGDLLQASGTARTQMPRLVEGAEPAGMLRSELQQAWGISGEVTVAGGASDNAASACGIGAMREGEGFVSLGTSGVVLMAREICNPAPETAVHTFCHAVPQRWYQMGVTLSATQSLNWLAGISGKSAEQMTAALSDKLQPPGRVRFLPYLSGERTPHNDAFIRGSLTGLGTDTDASDLTRAILEGVGYSLRDCAEALTDTGVKMRSLYVLGGGAASIYWVKLIATILGQPIQRLESGEHGAALGAARLAMTAATGADPLSIMLPPKGAMIVDPEPSMVEPFEQSYGEFRKAYRAIRSIQ